MRKLLIAAVILILIALSIGGYFYYQYNLKTPQPLPPNPDAIVHRLASPLQKFVADNNYNQDYCFIVNLAVPSKYARFYIYNIKQHKIIDKGLVTHGKGSDKESGFQFSNVINSNASSKGKYKIGAKYFGQFGLAYKLHGLESTNNKAFERFVVLHSHDCVPSGQSYFSNICRSDGCPTVAPSFLNKLSAMIDSSKKPILLYIDYVKK